MSTSTSKTLFLALCDTLQESGWGVCSKYLDTELSKLTKVVNLQKYKALQATGKMNGPVLHAVADLTFQKTVPVSGTFDAGYCFFENYLYQESIENAKRYDLILAGSTWNADILKGYGVEKVETLIQGIDPAIFNPITKPKDPKWRDYFVIFSGGKFEMRKGQDIVLAAVKILQKKYKDIILVNLWENKWPNSIDTMRASPYIQFRDHGETWVDKMSTVYAMNRMYMGRCISYPLLPQSEVRNVIRNSDLGLFLSRCEGGTNLALMEYMACGKPVVATNSTGHKDILTEDNCFLVKELIQAEFMADGQAIAMWDEPDLDEVIAKVEMAYKYRDMASEVGRQGAKTMRKLTWENTAKKALSIIQEYAG